jgi:hypothetical protein
LVDPSSPDEPVVVAASRHVLVPLLGGEAAALDRTHPTLGLPGNVLDHVLVVGEAADGGDLAGATAQVVAVEAEGPVQEGRGIGLLGMEGHVVLDALAAQEEAQAEGAVSSIPAQASGLEGKAGEEGLEASNVGGIGRSHSSGQDEARSVHDEVLLVAEDGRAAADLAPAGIGIDVREGKAAPVVLVAKEAKGGPHALLGLRQPLLA